jgi:hypothetical protein
MMEVVLPLFQLSISQFLDYCLIKKDECLMKQVDTELFPRPTYQFFQYEASFKTPQEQILQEQVYNNFPIISLLSEKNSLKCRNR